MTGLTEFVTKPRREDLLVVWLMFDDDVYQVLKVQLGPWRRRGPRPWCRMGHSLCDGGNWPGLGWVRNQDPELGYITSPGLAYLCQRARFCLRFQPGPPGSSPRHSSGIADTP